MTGGAHMLQVKTVDYQGTVIGTSDEIPFAYTAPATDNFLKSFTAHPSGVMQLGQTVQFDATVDTTVRSIELKVGSAGTFVMDKKSDGVFAKPLVIDKEGVHKVDVTLILDGGQKMPYMDRATLDVHAPLFGVGQLKVVNNAADPSKAALSWSAIGSPTGYVVRYGLKQDDLASEVKVPTTQVEISGLAIGKQYFFQIFALDEKGQVAGKASDIAMIMTQGQSAAGEQEQVAAPSCTVVGIKLRTEKVGDQYFLVWDAIPGAVEYHVYKSDFEVKSITSMQKVATTTVPKFVYPFNAQAKKDEYTYYSVVATCSDGKNLQIDNVKKVHT